MASMQSSDEGFVAPRTSAARCHRASASPAPPAARQASAAAEITGHVSSSTASQSCRLSATYMSYLCPVGPDGPLTPRPRIHSMTLNLSVGGDVAEVHNGI